MIESLAQLTPDPRNARRHNPRNVGMLEKALNEVGAARSIVIDERGVVLAGNATIEAAGRAGIERVHVVDADGETLVAVRRTGLTQAQKTRLALYDNRTAELADWDAEVMADLVENERQALDGLFTDSELAEIVADFEEPADADAVPQIDHLAELDQRWQVAPGDIWQTGEHRLLCGDSTDRQSVARLFDQAQPFLMVTDPPYGVNYDAAWRAEAMAGGKTGDMALGRVLNDDTADWAPAWGAFHENGGCVAYVWHASSHSSTVADSIFSTGFELRTLIVWAKNHLVISRGDYHHQHETCWYAVKKGASARFTEDRTQSTLWKNIDDVLRPGELVFVAKDAARKVYAIRGDRSTLWQIPKPTKSETGHSTQKPLECMARPMRNHDAPQVYDPFLGSGTTMVAAQNLSRQCFGVEISTGYAAVILDRMTSAFPKIKLSKHAQNG